LIVSLVAIIFLTVSKQETEKENEPVFSGERADIVSLTFRLGDREVRIRKAGTWVMEGEVESIVNETLINKMLDDLKEIVKVSTVASMRNVDPAEFGFDDPFISITLKFRERPAENLIIGTSHPNGQSYYARMKGHEEIFLIGSVYPKIIPSRLRKMTEEAGSFPPMGPLPQSRIFNTTRMLYS
jgi:hypothetical protein